MAAELTSDQSPVFHWGQRNSLQDWTVSLSLWLHLLSSPPASAALRHTAPRRRVPPPQLFVHCRCKETALNVRKNRHERTRKKKKSCRSHLRPGRVVPAARVAVSVAAFLVVGFVLPAAVAVVHLLGLSVGAADLGAVYFQGPVPQAALGRALALAGHVPPACVGAKRELAEVKSRAEGREMSHSTNLSSHSVLQGSVMTAGRVVP